MYNIIITNSDSITNRLQGRLLVENNATTTNTSNNVSSSKYQIEVKFNKSIKNRYMTIKLGGISDVWNVPIETTEIKVKLDNEVK